jgi:uncharacterized PurR-regulated membrane protein YhhQ (DUF165 family)
MGNFYFLVNDIIDLWRPGRFSRNAVWGVFVTRLVAVRQTASRFLFGLGQNGDVFGARLLGNRH